MAMLTESCIPVAAKALAEGKKADEAIYIDSTGMTIEEEANEVIKIIEEKRR